jgi:hypothetical protein
MITNDSSHPNPGLAAAGPNLLSLAGAPVLARARRGKIARLPMALREQLNLRLQNGQTHAAVAEWLNGLAEVKALLAAHFEGAPVTEDNISRWRGGGYLAWEEHQRSLEAVALLAEESGDLAQASPESVANLLAGVLSAKLAVRLQGFEAMPEGEDKARLWGQLLGALVLLRRGDLYAERLRAEKERFEHRKFRNEKEFEEALLRWAGRPGNRERLRQVVFSEDAKTPKEKRLERKARVARMKRALGIKCNY